MNDQRDAHIRDSHSDSHPHFGDQFTTQLGRDPSGNVQRTVACQHATHTHMHFSLIRHRTHHFHLYTFLKFKKKCYLLTYEKQRREEQ